MQNHYGKNLAKLCNCCVHAVLGQDNSGKLTNFRMGYAPLYNYCLDKQRMRTMSKHQEKLLFLTEKNSAIALLQERFLLWLMR